MAVLVSCSCGQSFELRDEFRGTAVRCPNCGTVRTAGGQEAGGDPIFSRDLFLLRQQTLAINEKYFVNDEAGQPLLFVERPRYLFRTVLALLAGMIVAFGAAMAVFAAAALAGEAAVAVAGLLVPFILLGVFVVVSMSLTPLRNVTFYAGQNQSAPRVLVVLQDAKVQFPTRTFTLRDGSGQILARFHKNLLTDIFRKRWQAIGPIGQQLFTVREDSIILSLLRRVLGPLFGLLRTNFIFTAGDSERVIGEFKRKVTILDRYVLDLKADRLRQLDRRVAVAVAVMLDTGERR